MVADAEEIHRAGTSATSLRGARKPGCNRADRRSVPPPVPCQSNKITVFQSAAEERYSMNNHRYDAIVIGGGHNGLVNAAYLAKAGKRVLVLERRHVVGGATITEEVYPGFKFLIASYLISMLRPEVIQELELARHGLEIMPLESTYVPLLDGNYLADWPDHDATKYEIGR